MTSLMNRRRFMQTTVASTVAAGLWTRGKHAQAIRRPNMVLICSDQQHWQAWGGADPSFHTPHLDALARDGITFTHAFCQTPQCSPSRAALHTGRYPHRTGVIGNLDSIRHDGVPVPPLPTDLPTIASRLHDAGYCTAYFGKWHLGNHEAFQEHFDVSALDGHPDADTIDRSVAFLEEQVTKGDRPFALFVSINNPHDIYEFGEFSKPDTIEPPLKAIPHPVSWTDSLEGKPPPQRQFMADDQGAWIHHKPDVFWEKYREVYREKCRLFDADAGRVLDTLDRLGLRSDTFVVCTSDHGDMDTQHRLVFKGPFMYEHMVRVPLIVRPPAGPGPGPGASSEALVILSDLMPTLCDFADADPGTHDGCSLAPYLAGTGPAPARDFVVSQYYNKQRWVSPIRMLRTRDWKYNRYALHGEELYDLHNDPHEMVNLAHDPGYVKVRVELASRLDVWMTEHDDTAFATQQPTNRKGTWLDPRSDTSS